jgi:hypothetical protein
MIAVKDGYQTFVKTISKQCNKKIIENGKRLVEIYNIKNCLMNRTCNSCVFMGRLNWNQYRCTLNDLATNSDPKKHSNPWSTINSSNPKKIVLKSDTCINYTENGNCE